MIKLKSVLAGALLLLFLAGMTSCAKRGCVKKSRKAVYTPMGYM